LTVVTITFRKDDDDKYQSPTKNAAMSDAISEVSRGGLTYRIEQHAFRFSLHLTWEPPLRRRVEAVPYTILSTYQSRLNDQLTMTCLLEALLQHYIF